MFTGLIERTGVVERAGARLAVRTGWRNLKDGESIAVSGVCLTVASRSGDRAEFDLVRETLSRTTLGRLKRGARVNLERAMKAGDRLGGHVVQGHVDGTGRVLRAGADFRVATPLAAQMVSKGSVTVDGVSLTVVDATDREFSVALIPTTLRLTTLGRLRRGARVNVEIDVLAKYAKRRTSTLTMDFLRKAGF